MRIIAGEFRRRVLQTPGDAETTRPMPDRVRESLFGLLRGHCEGANVFDGFAGTGAIGLEAVSRGARHCVLVERDRRVGEILKRNVQTLGVEDRCDVVVGDALGPGALARVSRPLTLGFLDPPYPLVEEPVGFARVMAQMRVMVDILDEKGFAILRTPWPLRHKVGEEVKVEAAAPAPFRKRPKERREWKREVERGGVRGESAVKGGGGVKSRSAAGTPRTPRMPNIERMREEEVEWLDLDDQGRLVDSSGRVVEDEIEVLPPPTAATGAKVTWVEADLTLPNAKGPETHVYAGMAVHLYMRR